MEVIERLERLASQRQLDVKAATKGYTSTEVVEYADKYAASSDAGDPLAIELFGETVSVQEMIKFVQANCSDDPILPTP